MSSADRQEVLDLYAFLPGISELPEAERTALADVSRLERRGAGVEIISEGEDGDDVFILLEGEIEVVRSVGGAEQSPMTLGPGAMFGLLAGLDGLRHATCRTLGDTKVVKIERAALNALEAEHVMLALAFQRTLCRQLGNDYRALVRRITDLRSTA